MKKTTSNKILIFVSILTCTLFFTSCIRKKPDHGKVITKNIKVTPFQDLKLLENASVNIIPGDTFKVVVKGKEKFVKELAVKVENGTLIISEIDHKSFRKGDFYFGTYTSIDYKTEIYVTMPTLRNIYQEGNSSIHIEQPMQGDSIKFDIEGNSDMRIEGLTAKKLKLTIEGNASVKLNKITTAQTFVDIEGNSDMDINFNNAGEVQVGGSGNTFVKLTGTTQTRPVCTMSGNISFQDYTKRSQKQ